MRFSYVKNNYFLPFIITLTEQKIHPCCQTLTFEQPTQDTLHFQHSR